MADRPDDLPPEDGDASVPEFDSPDHGAEAPRADVVVPIERAQSKRASAQVPPPPPPPPSDEASPPSDGKKGGGKKGKVVDWGKYNFLLQNFALIYGTDTVWDGAERMIMKISNMAHAHGSDMVKMWKASEDRRTIMPKDVVFDPTGQSDPTTTVNLFGGFELEPKKGDVEPYLALGRYLTSRTSDDPEECERIFQWLLCWLAYPLQHPGTKLRTAVVMHGDEGAGKNVFFECVLQIYGRYGTLVGQDELEDKFNDWRSGKCMVIGDEVATRSELVHQKNKLKSLVTGEKVQINPKNLPRREERNHINIVFLSNELQPLALDNSDRRYLVIYTPGMKERAFYERLRHWQNEGGISALYDYLLRVDLSEFDPYAPAPITQAKRKLIDLNRKTPERFWIQWASGELDLPYWSCASGQIYRAYLKFCQRTGDRFPMQQPIFTAMLLRVSESLGPTLDPARPPVHEWIANVTEAGGRRKTTRLLLVTPRPEDRSSTEFATECVRTFEEALRDYLGHDAPPSPSSSQGAGKGASE